MQLHQNITFFMQLTKLQAIMTRKFDSGLGGISLNEFVIMSELMEAGEGKLRRIDLAEKVGLTASGITRLLLPMEKIGLIKREADPTDARASFVVIASGGKKKYEEAIERAEYISNTVLETISPKQLKLFIASLDAMTKSAK